MGTKQITWGEKLAADTARVRDLPNFITNAQPSRQDEPCCLCGLPMSRFAGEGSETFESGQEAHANCSLSPHTVAHQRSELKRQEERQVISSAKKNSKP